MSIAATVLAFRRGTLEIRAGVLIGRCCGTRGQRSAPVGGRANPGHGFHHSGHLSLRINRTPLRPLLQIAQKRLPARLIFLFAFGGSKDLPAAVSVHTNRRRNRDVLHFTAPAALRADSVKADIWVLALNRAYPPLFNAFINLLIEGADCPWAPQCRVISSARRTIPRRRYISIRASSIELSRRDDSAR